MKNAIVWIIVVAIVVFGIYWITRGSSNMSTTYTQTTENATSSVTTLATTSPVVAPAPKTVTVTYSDTGFNPKSVEISVGDTVQFVNQSSKNMWVGSAVHPTHEKYDGTTLKVHCAAGTTPSFDECKGEPKGATYSFTFSKAGSFGYHDHITSSNTGMVVVK